TRRMTASLVAKASASACSPLSRQPTTLVCVLPMLTVKTSEGSFSVCGCFVDFTAHLLPQRTQRNSTVWHWQPCCWLPVLAFLAHPHGHPTARLPVPHGSQVPRPCQRDRTGDKRPVPHLQRQERVQSFAVLRAALLVFLPEALP